MTPQIDYGRALMGDSLGFHIIFALLGVGLPLLVSLAELIGILRHDAHFTQMAKRWSFAMSTLFVVGAVSGTIISFQFSTIWPGFIAFAGPIIGLPLSMEGYAFFIEAIFLGIYLFSWKRLSPWQHWLTSLPIVIGAAAGTFFITTANAFMNNPTGFILKNGIPSDINAWQAMLGPATPTEVTHSMLAYYTTTCLTLAGIAAYSLWRNPKSVYQRKVIVFTTILGLLFALGVGLSGDRSGKYLAKQEPLKLAAAEQLYKTQSDAPLMLGPIQVPGLLSFLAAGSTSAVVYGLNSFDPNTWPPLVIHYFFEIMVLVGAILVILPGLFLLLYWYKPWREKAFTKLPLLGVLLAAVAGFIAVECGWMLTEIGRQPWTVRNFLTTKEAFTKADNVAIYGFIFPTLYLALFIVTYLVLRNYYAKHPVNE